MSTNSDKQDLTLADVEAHITAIQNGVDSFFLVVMGIVVFLMQCGFAFLEAGSVRSKNTTNILIKNLLDSCISGLCYWAVGWAFAYGDPSNPFCGYGQFFAIGMTGNDFASWFFQFVFAATASTIVSGALAERCEFVAYFAYCASLTAAIYPIISHWCWADGGWLKSGPQGVTFVDFAGSGVVHLHGGTCAFVGALLLGPRIGRFPKKKQNKPAVDLKGHSVPFAALGGFILMFGFFAFNGGSQLSITQPGDGEVVARAMFNTMLSGGAAALATLMVNKLFLRTRKWSLLLTINAALAGMVAACAGCNVMEPWAAVVTGLGASFSYLLVARLVETMKVDDPLDAVGVHFGGGLWGLFITPILMRKTGIIYAPNLTSLATLGWNMVGAAAIIGWSGITIGIVFALLKLMRLLRVSEEVEIKGLDIFKHGEPAYPLIAYGHGWEDDLLSLPGDKQMDAQELERAQMARLSLGDTMLPPSVAVGDGELNRQFEHAELHAQDVKVQNGRPTNAVVPYTPAPQTLVPYAWVQPAYGAAYTHSTPYRVWYHQQHRYSNY